MIDIYNVNPVNKGALLAKVTVYIEPWDLEIHEVGVFEKGDRRWVNLPAQKNMDGTYTTLISFKGKHRMNRFSDQVMEAVDKMLEESGGEFVAEDVVTLDDECPF